MDIEVQFALMESSKLPQPRVIPRKLIHRMPCPHCCSTLQFGAGRCPHCSGGIVYVKATLRVRLLRLVVSPFFLAALYFTDTDGRGNPSRIYFNIIIFTACAVGFWNHRSPMAETDNVSLDREDSST